MSDTLLGVLIGGAIASITPIITITIEYKKWKKDKRIDFLKLKREKLETSFKDASEKITIGMQDGKFSVDTLSDFDFLFPKNVSEALQKFMNEEYRSPKTTLFHNYEINREMKKALSELDHQLEEIIN